MPTLRSIFLVCLLAFLLKIFVFSPISLSPEIIQFPPPPSSPLLLSTNDYLQRVTKVGEGTLEGPEGLYIDKEGIIYTATRDGWIKRVHQNGSVEDWKMIGGQSMLGITMSADGSVLVCDVDKGLLKVDHNSVKVLSSHMNGTKIRFVDDVIEASDGTVYFSDASTKFGFHNWILDMVEGIPHGRLLKYDPNTKETTMVLDGLGFANGVALSQDQDFLVVCESWKFRCMKHWLKGEERGKTEIFIENLPGGPDNINLAPDGSFWIALLELRTNTWLDFVHKSKLAKHLVSSFPKLLELLNGAKRKAMAVNVGTNGEIIRKFDDPDGTVMSFVTTALEFEGHLYLGSLNSNFIGKLQLKQSNPSE
ncbi:protein STRICTOSIDINE SYNTHASE-LIKE 4-like [Macadamia integrifolia]|uniref:protein STRICTOSIDINE SYNTHASE-LIKE 4-like n=1 Tax=Macadamia integrifolia TaxID=60698 RepID=UPI001C4F3A15|nr:protein STRICTOSIDINE SYNTHASE-LIKE 4-like [Macadamia integrifolia]